MEYKNRAIAEMKDDPVRLAREEAIANFMRTSMGSRTPRGVSPGRTTPGVVNSAGDAMQLRCFSQTCWLNITFSIDQHVHAAFA